MMWGYGFNWLNMTLMMLGIVVFIVLVWVIVRRLSYRMISPTHQTHGLPASGSSAIDILNQRYARGEIDAENFERMREQIGSTENAQQKIWVEKRSPAGEKLFDGRKRSS